MTSTAGRGPGSSRLRGGSAGVLVVISLLSAAGCGSDTGPGAGGSAGPAASPGAAPSGSTSTDSSGTSSSGTPATPATPATPQLPQESVFSVLSPWNTLANDRPVHPQSANLLQQARSKVGRTLDGTLERVPVEAGVAINTEAWTGPVVADGVPTVVSCRQVQCGDGSDEVTLAIPDGIDPDPRYDGWYTVFDTDEQQAYDLWRARREDDGSISYQFMRQWDLNGPGFQQPYAVSARGSGLPLFGGLIRPGELERGEVNHALAISVPGAAAGSFVQPASSTNGNGPAGSLPEGARIFLRPDVELTAPVDPRTGRPYPFDARQQEYADHLVDTLKTYGAIVVDRAAVPTLYVERIEQTDRVPPLQGYELTSLGLEDFAVVDFDPSDRIEYPPADELVDATGPTVQASGLTEGATG